MPSHHTGLFLWRIGTIILYIDIIKLTTFSYSKPITFHRLLWYSAFIDLWTTLRQDQIYVLLAAMITGAYRLIDRRHFIAGGLLIDIVVALKPNLAVWPAMLLLAGHWRVVLPAIASCLTLHGVAVARYGIDSYAQWLDLVRLRPFADTAGNSSVSAFLLRLNVSPDLATIGAALILLGVALWTWRCKPEFLHLSLVALVAAQLASPVSWPGMTVLLLPFLPLLPWFFHTLTGIIVAGMLATPSIIVAIPGLASFFMWPLMIILIRTILLSFNTLYDGAHNTFSMRNPLTR
ncbi:MAG: glycosyltransferase family 87 protein [Anaerolineae bacterium]